MAASCSKLPFLKKKQPTSLSSKNLALTYPLGPTENSKNFIDKTKQYGLENVKGRAFNAVDLNGDKYTDLVLLPNYYSHPEVYLFNPQKQKFEKSKLRFFEGNVKASYLLIYDINNDYIPDAIVGVLNQKSELSREPIKVFIGKLKDGHVYFYHRKDGINSKSTPAASISLLDYDLDGWLDLFVGNWFSFKDNKTIPMRDKLFKGDRGFFKEQSKILQKEAQKEKRVKYFLNAVPTYGSSTCDVDRNGYPDILTVSSAGFDNKLWVNRYSFNQKGRYFEDISRTSYYAHDVDGQLDPRGGGRSFFSACADYNDDGIMDLFLAELTHSYDHENFDRSSILTGKEPKGDPRFIRTEYINDNTALNWDQGDRRGIWIDLDFDGRIDLLVDNSGFPPGSRLVYFRQQADNSFKNEADKYGINIVNPTGSIILDVNRDGKMDILTGQSNIRDSRITEKLYLLENNIPRQGRRSIRFFPQGTRANFAALGGMISLKTQKNGKVKTKTQWIEYSQGGLPSQNEQGVIFGLDEGELAVSVKMRWPIMHESNQVPFEREYQLNQFTFNEFVNITLCESGKSRLGRQDCL